MKIRGSSACREGAWVALVGALLLMGCGKSVRIGLPKIERPVTLGDRVGPGVAVTPAATRLGRISGASTYHRADSSRGDGWGGTVNTTTVVTQSSAQANVANAIGGRPGACLTGVQVDLDYRFGWNVDMKMKYAGDAFDLGKGGQP